MNSEGFRVETGLQLITRLTKKPSIENFYPIIFQDGPKQSEVIEIYSNGPLLPFVSDVLTEALLPTDCGGPGASVLIFVTDIHFDIDIIANMLKNKIRKHKPFYTEKQLASTMLDVLCNLKIMEIYNASQFYVSLHSLESIMLDHPNISLIVFHTLTSFYWSEQGIKITKMDVYIKKLLLLIQKLSKEYKVSLMYTRPEYFSSSKDSIENLEECVEQPTFEKLNYRIQIQSNGDGTFCVNVRSFNNIHKKIYRLQDGIKWL